MGESRGFLGDPKWENFVEAEAREIRQRFLRERIQVSSEDSGMHTNGGSGGVSPGVRSGIRPGIRPGIRQISPTSGIDAGWFRSLGLKRQWIVRGAAAGRESRKAVLIGSWAAAQWGMWFLPPKNHEVVFALPSGYQPSKSVVPHGVRFKSMKIRQEEIVELDGVRVTDPLRTYLDLCRMKDETNAWLAAGWLLERGMSAGEIAAYAEEFEGAIHENRRQLAVAIPARAAELKSYRYVLAYALLKDSPARVRVHCELDEIGHATLLAGNDLVIAVDEDPLLRDLDAEPEGRQIAFHLRKRERWVTARGYRKLYFTSKEIEANPDGFVSEVLGARHLRRRDLRF